MAFSIILSSKLTKVSLLLYRCECALCSVMPWLACASWWAWHCERCASWHLLSSWLQLLPPPNLLTYFCQQECNHRSSVMWMKVLLLDPKGTRNNPSSPHPPLMLLPPIIRRHRIHLCKAQKPCHSYVKSSLPPRMAALEFLMQYLRTLLVGFGMDSRFGAKLTSSFLLWLTLPKQNREQQLLSLHPLLPTAKWPEWLTFSRLLTIVMPFTEGLGKTRIHVGYLQW